jgi:hypothetical protein
VRRKPHPIFTKRPLDSQALTIGFRSISVRNIMNTSPPLPKRHHYVPVMLQKRFLDNAGWLHSFTKAQPERGVVRSRPQNLFLKTNLYSEVGADGSRNLEMEFRFSQLETAADPIIEKIVLASRQNELPALSAEEREIWYAFLLAQWKRVPDLHQTVTTDAELSNHLHELLDELHQAKPERQIEIDELRNLETEKRILKNVRVRALATASDKVLSILRKRGLRIVKITQPNKQFVLCSRPVIKLTSPGKTHLLHPECELWLPIANDIAVGLGKGPGREILMPINSDKVRKLNLAYVSHSSAFAGSSATLIKSLSRPR